MDRLYYKWAPDDGTLTGCAISGTEQRVHNMLRNISIPINLTALDRPSEEEHLQSLIEQEIQNCARKHPDDNFDESRYQNAVKDYGERLDRFNLFKPMPSD